MRAKKMRGLSAHFCLPVFHHLLMSCPSARAHRYPSGCNAPMESFWGTLKNELVHHRRFETRQQAKQEISEYIEVFYNRQRKQKRLGYMSPAKFTQRYYATLLAA